MMDANEILREVRQIEIRAKGLVNQIFSGEYHSVFKGRGMAFSEVREYQYGDDIRSIDWNVTARFGHPFVKIFEEERELTVMIVVDMSASMNFGSKSITKKNLAILTSATLALSALKNNDKVGLIIFTDTIERFIPPGKSRTHILRIIAELVQFTPKGKGTAITGAMEFLRKAIKKKSIAFLISDFFDEGFEQNLRLAGAKHDLIPILLRDQRELNLTRTGLITLFDEETGTYVERDFSSRSALEYFSFRTRQHDEALKKSFAFSKLDLVEIPVTGKDSFVQPLVRFFKNRGRRW